MQYHNFGLDPLTALSTANDSNIDDLNSTHADSTVQLNDD
jgi:hypothetical protein